MAEFWQEKYRTLFETPRTRGVIVFSLFQESNFIVKTGLSLYIVRVGPSLYIVRVGPSLYIVRVSTRCKQRGQSPVT